MKIHGREITLDDRGRVVYVDTRRPPHPLALELAGVGAREVSLLGKDDPQTVGHAVESLPEPEKPGPKQVGARSFT